MCVTPIPEEKLENMKKFKYTSTDSSLLYNKVMSPWLNKVVTFLPLRLAPNVITIFSLVMNVIAASYTFWDVGFDFSARLCWTTCLVQGLTQFLYQVLDNLDGKQARRTGTSSPFGMLLDHGCDIFTNCLTGFNMTHLFLLGNINAFSYVIFLGLTIGFYTMTYEEYVLGEMHFAAINGSDEGNLGVAIFGVTCALIGQGWLDTTLFCGVKLGQIFGSCICLGGLSCAFNTFKNIYKKKGFKQVLKIFFDWGIFYTVIGVPLFAIIFKTDFYILHKWIILVTSCLLFARITMNIQITIVTMDTLKWEFFPVLVSLCLNATFIISDDTYKYWFLCGVGLSQATELIMFIILRSKQITNHLGIKMFTINPQIPVSV